MERWNLVFILWLCNMTLTFDDSKSQCLRWGFLWFNRSQWDKKSTVQWIKLRKAHIKILNSIEKIIKVLEWFSFPGKCTICPLKHRLNQLHWEQLKCCPTVQDYQFTYGILTCNNFLLYLASFIKPDLSFLIALFKNKIHLQ